MKRQSALLAVAAFAVAFLPATLSAQSIFVGGGVTVPTGDYNEYAKAGWMASAGVTLDVADAIWLGVEGFYGQNSHDCEGCDGDKTNPLGVMGAVGLDIDTGGPVSPYAFGGGGLLVHKYSPDTGEGDSESKFGLEFGAGLDFDVSESAAIWVEGRWMGTPGGDEGEKTAFFGVLAGVSFGIG